MKPWGEKDTSEPLEPGPGLGVLDGPSQRLELTAHRVGRRPIPRGLGRLTPLEQGLDPGRNLFRGREPMPSTSSTRRQSASRAADSAAPSVPPANAALVSRTQSKTTAQALDTLRSSSSASPKAATKGESTAVDVPVDDPDRSANWAIVASRRARAARAASRPSSVKLKVSR